MFCILFLKLMFFSAEITPQESFGQKSSDSWRTNDKLNLLNYLSFVFCLFWLVQVRIWDDEFGIFRIIFVIFIMSIFWVFG